MRRSLSVFLEFFLPRHARRGSTSHSTFTSFQNHRTLAIPFKIPHENNHITMIFFAFLFHIHVLILYNPRVRCSHINTTRISASSTIHQSLFTNYLYYRINTPLLSITYTKQVIRKLWWALSIGKMGIFAVRISLYIWENIHIALTHWVKNNSSLDLKSPAIYCAGGATNQSTIDDQAGYHYFGSHFNDQKIEWNFKSADPNWLHLTL